MQEALVERAEMEMVRRMCDAVVASHARRLREASHKVELTPQVPPACPTSDTLSQCDSSCTTELTCCNAHNGSQGGR